MHEHDKTMTKDFAERFIAHCHIGLARQAITKFALFIMENVDSTLERLW